VHKNTYFVRSKQLREKERRNKDTKTPRRPPFDSAKTPNHPVRLWPSTVESPISRARWPAHGKPSPDLSPYNNLFAITFRSIRRGYPYSTEPDLRNILLVGICRTSQRDINIFNSVSDRVGNAVAGGGASHPVVAWGIGSSLAAAVADMFGSGELVRESCMREACRHCRACVAGQGVLARGCLPVSQQGCRHRRRSRRRTRARARSGRPGVMLERTMAVS